MRCPNCGREMEKGWSYCPRCGARLRRDFLSSIFDRMFSGMSRELRQMNRMMEKEIEAMDISPYFRAREASPRPQGSRLPRGSGFSVRITRSGRNPPRVSVRTFGKMDRERVRQQLNRQLGALGLKSGEGRPASGKPPSREGGETREPPEAGPKSVHEPRTEVKRLDGRVVVNLDMPGVRSLEDIHVRELESSLEVKAVAGDKAYFKILTKPGQFRLNKKGFSRGVLHLEFS